MALLTAFAPQVRSSKAISASLTGFTETRTFGFEPGVAAELSLVVPTYNERGNIAEFLARLDCVLADLDWEIVFVDDHSPDGTADFIRTQCLLRTDVRLIERIGRRGLSSACLEGIEAASAPIFAVMDADLQHDETILPAMFAALLTQNLDVVVGTRNAEGGSMGEFSTVRVALSRLGRALSRMVAPALVSDPMSGFFLMRRSFFEEAAGRVEGRGFKILFDLLTSATGRVRVGEVGYRFRNRHHGESKLGASVLFEYLLMLGRKLLLPKRQRAQKRAAVAGVHRHA